MSIESIDDYQVFHNIMKKKNADLNAAALKILQNGPPEAYITPKGDSKVTDMGNTPMGPTKTGEDAKMVDPKMSVPTAKSGRHQELKDKKNKGKINNTEAIELGNLEREQLELAEQISRQEMAEWERMSMIFNLFVCFYIFSVMKTALQFYHLPNY